MIDSPFDNYQNRIFLCHGNTRDKYVLANGLQINFDQLLFLHLKERGYTKTLLYNHYGLYFYDEGSRDWFLNIPSTDHDPAISQLTPGPGGLSLRKKKPVTNANSPPSSKKQLLYPNLTQLSEIQSALCRLINECKHGVIIFDGDHLVDFAHNGPSIEHFRGLLERDLRQLAIDNHLIVIFISGLKGSELADHLHNSKPVLNFLYQLDSDNKNTGIASSIAIGNPERDEITALIDYYRLRRNLKIEWAGLQQYIQILTGYLKTHQKGVNDLCRFFEQLCQSNKTLNPEQLHKLTSQGIDNQPAKLRLANMVGMDELKKEVNTKINYFNNLKKSQAVLEPSTSLTALQRLYRPIQKGYFEEGLHIALMGNPGTGKTTVAKLVGEIYRDAGILETGHTVKVGKQDLVAGYVGQTAIKTRECIEQARGGVLFIDEAYGLAQGGSDDFGIEAITVLLEAMSDLRAELVVIVAGYPNEIQQLIDSNPGFESRFGAKINLPDMLPEQLLAVFIEEVTQSVIPITLSLELDQALPAFFDELYNNREDHEGFANARTVIEKVFKPMLMDLTSQSMDEGSLQADIQHIPEPFQCYLHNAQHQKELTPLTELNELVGLSGVKNQINGLIAQLENNQARQQGGTTVNQLSPGHYLFSGNPGTGKTTVARLMAKQFKRMGLLPKNKLTERSASDLIGQYVGSTENAVRELLNNSLGGVLFIDEAHQLATNEQGYGSNALAPFIPFMTSRAHEICIIFAGYSSGLEKLFKMDVGLRRRTTTIAFDDFTAEELTATFFRFAKNSGYQVEDHIQPALQALFSWLVENKGEQFGNAGTAEQILNLMCARLASRMQTLTASDTEPSLSQRNTLLIADIPEHEKCRIFLGRNE